MASFDDLPELETHGLALIVGLLVTFWVFLKVKLLRERIALRTEGEDAPKAPAWQHALARSPRTTVVLGTIAVLLVAAMAYFGIAK